MSIAAQIGKTKTSFGKVFATRGVSEAAGIVCALGGVSVLKHVMPDQLDSLYGAFAKTVVEPNLHSIEQGLDNVTPGFKSQGHDAWRAETPPKERAKEYAQSIIDLGVIAFGFGLAAQAGGQYVMEKALNLESKSIIGIKLPDYAAQTTAFGLLNTVALKPSYGAQDKLSKMMQERLGMDEENANDKARYLVNFTAPNLIGAAVSTGVHYNMLNRGIA